MSMNDTTRETGGGFWDGAEVISTYTREQAIEDGELVAIEDEAREAGFVYPVALTRALFGRIENIPTSRVGIEDIAGRLWDVLWMARCAGRRSTGSTFHFQLLMGAKGTRTRKITLRADCGPGDNGEPVITIGFPEDF